MKHQTIALAAVLACGSVFSQSSVTLFGVVDTGVTAARGSVSDRTQVVSGNLASSRLGFRGTEDLGGGMFASFWLEAQVASDTGAGAPTLTNNQNSGATGGGGLTFGRRSTLGIGGKWGEVRLGRDYTPTFSAQVRYDPFLANGIGATQSLIGTAAPGAPYVARGGVNGVAVRASNSVAYWLPSNAAGVYGRVMTYFGENASGTPNSSDGDGTAAMLGWTNGTIDVTAAYARTQFGIGDISTATIGGAYRFANKWRLSASAVQDQVDGGTDGKGWLVGLTVPVTTGTLQASYSTFRLDDAARSGANKIAVGYIHDLSKRTAVYGVATRLSNRGASAQAVGGAVTAAGDSSTALGVGIRHNF